MNTRRRLILTSSLLAAGLVLLGAYISFVGNVAPPASPNGITYPEYQPLPHSNIAIGSDSDFTKVGAASGCECVRSGTGTQSEPFLIAGWIINASKSDGIVIVGTTAYFAISDVRINGSQNGINLNNAANGRVVNSLITDSSHGIFTFSSMNLDFENNTLTHTQFGIQLEVSDNNIVSSNRFDESGQIAIFVRGSANIVSNNVIVHAGFGGINVDGTPGLANANFVEGNIVKDSGRYGIATWLASNCVIRNNTVTGSGLGGGISLTDQSVNNMVEGNTVTGNRGNGILLTGSSSNNTVTGNTAKGNGDGINYFDLFDASGNNIWQNNTYNTKKPNTLQ